MAKENTGATPEQWELIINALNRIDGRNDRKRFNALSTPSFKCPQCREKLPLRYPLNQSGIKPS